MIYRVVLVFSLLVPFAVRAGGLVNVNVTDQTSVSQDLKDALKTCFDGSAADQVSACAAILDSGILESDPAKLAVILTFRGKALEDTRQEQKAIEDFDRAISLVPNYAAAFFYRGIAYDALKQYPSAIRDFSRAIDLKPDFADAFAERGLAAVSNKDFDAAVKDLTHAVELAPDNASSRAYLGDTYHQMGKLDLAVQSFNEAIRLADKWMWPHNDRGELFMERGDLSLAEKDFDMAVALEPKSPMGWTNRCRLRAITGKLDLALEDCNAAIGIDPAFVNTMVRDGDVSVMQDRALVHLKAGRLTQAIQDYNEAEKLVPKSAEVFYGRGIAKRRNGDTAGGDADIAAAKAIDPKIAERYAGYGVTP